MLQVPHPISSYIKKQVLSSCKLSMLYNDNCTNSDVQSVVVSLDSFALLFSIWKQEFCIY
jgi:hypothetical protein